jgi:hypothetical protein
MIAGLQQLVFRSAERIVKMAEYIDKMASQRRNTSAAASQIRKSLMWLSPRALTTATFADSIGLALTAAGWFCVQRHREAPFAAPMGHPLSPTMDEGTTSCRRR